jgi:hypothetical protein
MGTLVKLFGKSPRVRIVEAFSENPEEEFSAPEIELITGVARRSAYTHMEKLTSDGLIIKTKKVGKCNYYMLNKADTRGKYLPMFESIFTMGNIENAIKRDIGLTHRDPFPYDSIYSERFQKGKTIDLDDSCISPIEVGNPLTCGFEIYEKTQFCPFRPEYVKS